MTRAHLAEMIALMGPPPPELLNKGKRSLEFFHEDGEGFPTGTTLSANLSGQWRDEIPIPNPRTLEQFEENLQGSNKEAFLRFMRKMLQWQPEDRQTANHLLKDDWLNGQS